MSIPRSLQWLPQELDRLHRQSLARRLADRAGRPGPRVVVDSCELIHFGSNDYLGLAADPRVVEAVVAAVGRHGWGSGASPLILGHTTAHAALEARLADFEGAEAALVFPSGFAANVGAVASLAGPGDVIYADRKNHASLWDGCRLSRADVRPYAHGDVAELVRLLDRSARYRRRLIVTDSLFSMDGNFAPLAELADAAERYDAMLLVDEAHATGVFGAHGRGLAEQMDCEDRIAVRVGTLSKALGGVGGFVVGCRELIDWLLNRARPYVFSTAAPAAVCAAAIAALDIAGDEPHRRVELLARAAQLRARLAEQGWNVGRSTSQIIPVVVGSAEAALSLAAQLRQRGLFVPAIRPPSVPEGEACLRISLSWLHTQEMLDALVGALGALRG